MKPNDKTNNANEHNMVKNPLARGRPLTIYKCDQGIELGLPRNNTSLGIRVGLEPATRLQISSSVHQPLDHIGYPIKDNNYKGSTVKEEDRFSLILL